MLTASVSRVILILFLRFGKFEPVNSYNLQAYMKSVHCKAIY